jgi:hypothetical protein
VLRVECIQVTFDASSTKIKVGYKHRASHFVHGKPPFTLLPRSNNLGDELVDFCRRTPRLDLERDDGFQGATIRVRWYESVGEGEE